jgi:hypothetical protein
MVTEISKDRSTFSWSIMPDTEEEGTALLEMSGTTHLTTQHHIPEVLHLQ